MAFRMNMKESPGRAGKYTARTRKTKELSTQNGDPMVVIDWELLDGEDAGRIVPQFVCFVEPMKTANNAILRVLGQPAGEEVMIDAEAWVGKLGRVTVAIGPKGPTVTTLERPTEEQSARAVSAELSGGEDIPF